MFECWDASAFAAEQSASFLLLSCRAALMYLISRLMVFLHLTSKLRQSQFHYVQKEQLKQIMENTQTHSLYLHMCVCVCRNTKCGLMNSGAKVKSASITIYLHIKSSVF